ncbi:hypothetical protein CapIbe_016002 [Capra ibex]
MFVVGTAMALERAPGGRRVDCGRTGAVPLAHAPPGQEQNLSDPTNCQLSEKDLRSQRGQATSRWDYAPPHPPCGERSCGAAPEAHAYVFICLCGVSVVAHRIFNLLCSRS